LARDDSGRTFAVEPERLDRDGLLALVGDMQRVIDRQRQDLARQAATIAALQGGTPPAAAGASATAPSPHLPRRRTFPPVKGFDFTIVFDGGSLGNPGKGYGSYQIVDGRGSVVAEERLEYGDSITNNGAEFRTLVAALERTLAAAANGAPSVAIRGDSQLVINGVTGAWKIRHPDLKPLHERAVALLGRFARTDVRWHRRDRSVDALGH
jgi:ribonuclease HI